MSSLAQFADPVAIITTLAELGKRGQPMTKQPDGDTLERIACLLRQGALRGIYPQWAVKKEPGVIFTQAELNEIASCVEESFTSGIAGDHPGKEWRLTVYE